MNRPIKLLVVGSTNMDMIIKTPVIPRAGESSIIEGIKYCEGGKGANQAVAAARLGAQVDFITCLGNDDNGKKLLASLKKEGVDLSHVVIDERANTGLALILLEDGGVNRIMVDAGTNMLLPSEPILSHIRASLPDAVLLQLEIPRQTVIDICRECVKLGITTVLDAGPAQQFPLEDIQGITVLSPNETETAALCGITPSTDEEAEAAAQILMSRVAAKYVILKRGAQGAYVYGGGIAENFYPPKVTSVDTTAAGDSFTAAMTLEYLRTGDIKKAVVYGNFAGALAITKEGAQPSLPTANELENFIKE